MKIKKDEVEVLNKVRRKAHILGEKVLIVSKPDRARAFLISTKRQIAETRQVYKKLIHQVKQYKHLTHEVENLFDNYYIVDSAISDVLNSPIDKDYKKIVQTEKSPNVFIPRIYHILAELLKLEEFEIDRDILYGFLQAYQNKAHLSIRELSFVPFFLRIVLIENIDKLMQGSIVSLNEFKDAEYWFQQIIKKGKNQDYSKLTSNLASKYGVIPINLSFNLLQKLSQYGPDTRPIVKWLKLNLLKQGVKINDLAEIESKRQNYISNQIANTINSLRWINQNRWDDFVVDVNIVDSFLAKDPANIYSHLDPASQSAYRNEVVKISDKAGVHESEVAKLSLRLANQNIIVTDVKENPFSHIGYYLVGAGREELEKKIGYRKPFLEKLQSFILKKSLPIYLGGILIINIILTVIFISLFPLLIGSIKARLVFTALVFILNCDITINLVNILISSLIPVRALFRLDLSTGLDVRQATFVVIPSMFRDIKTAKELLRRLEVNYLGNRDEHVYFGLLMDFRDAQMETLATDQELVDLINQGIDDLNEKYKSNTKRFYLFHRRRIWNPHENVFMGWERKRGKLREFNLLLRNIRPTSYVESLPTELPFIKYILTIDEDTRLPKDSAIKLIGCIDHPLNRPIINNVTNKVISGYGIIQPRMTTKFSQARATVFSRLFSSAMGIDSYTGPAADVYQDLFNNSIFYGKGIYDVDTMEAIIGDNIPENQVLSHDLLEGLYIKVGFATDIYLFEGFPESYKEYILRMHRWIRGDWQIMTWLKSGSPKFSWSDKWKIFDNLRRSTLPIFAMIFLLISYLSFTNLFPFSLIYILFVVGSSFIISYLIRLFEWPKEMTLLMKVNNLFSNLDDVLVQIVYRFIFLLDQAIISLQAISISFYRNFLSHKYMLQWQNSHEVAKNLKGTLREFIYLMLPAEIISLGLIFFVSKYHHGFYAYLTLIFWLVAPVVAYHISQKDKIYTYKDNDIKFLRKIACRSARFFLELSQRGGNRLIPDHYQEEPVTNSPPATSPTNIGMHLLSNLSAYDLGYLSFSNLLERSRELFDSLDCLERYKGHFYNWYDIHSLQSLNPKYVSSVDSANLLVTFLTMKQGILDIINKPIINKDSLAGLADVLAVLIEDANLIIKDRIVLKSERRMARVILNEAKLALNKSAEIPTVNSIEAWSKILTELSNSNEKIKKIVSNLNIGLNKGMLSSIYSSTDHLNNLLKQQTDELSIFMSFKQAEKNRPIVRNEKKNHKLAAVLDYILVKLDTIPSLTYLAGAFQQEIKHLDIIQLIHEASLDSGEKENIEVWYQQLINYISEVEERAIKSQSEYQHIISLIDKFVAETDFAFLYNKERGLFHIGYNVTFEKIDNSFYDFLASEANAVSFMSILKNEVPVKHWFYLGRKLVQLDIKNVLLSSWGGSLFEYLTSLIFFKAHKESLLGSTAHLAVQGHINYGQKYNIPWGMGESAYSALDLNNNYQYQIFGHPDLGLKRDLKDYLVVAPYTTIMSLAINPKKAIANLRCMIGKKFLGRFGFYDAVDYTASLNSKNINKIGVPTKIYYAHHQGFSLQSLNNQINQNRLQTLFTSDPRVEALDTLFEEKVPSSIPTRPIKSLARLQTEYVGTMTDNTEIKQFIPLFTSYPRRAFLSNGAYTVNISNVGAGGSKVSDISLTRFREDTVAEPWGQFIYLYDSVKKLLWSPTTQPTGIIQGKNKIEYFENRAHFNKIHNDIESSLTIALAPDSNVEFRSLVLTNHGKEEKNLQIASYGEVALSKANDDLHHPSFEKLFIKSEYWQKYQTLVYSKPNKDNRGEKLYFAHKILINHCDKIAIDHTSSRAEVINRGGSLRQPDIFSAIFGRLKSALNYNFDPVFCFQNPIELKNNETITINYVNIFANSKEELIRNLKKYSSQKNINQAIKKSDTQGYEVINNLGLSREQALNYQALASRLLSPHYAVTPKKFNENISEAGVQALWRLGISGDLPILLVRFYDMNDLAVVKNMLLCHRYLKYKGIAHDLVLLNEYPASYIKSFEDEVDFLIRYNQSPINKAVRGNVFHLRSSHISAVDRENLIYQAKILIDSKDGTIEQQIQTLLQSGSRTPITYLKPIKKITSSGKDIAPDLDKLEFYNGLGGFSKEHKEYVMNINYNNSLITPSPWANIIANPNIGTVITESGAMYTWLYDSYDNRLTKRIDDPLIDRSSEIFYLRDEETGEFWNSTPLPIKSPHTYTVSHGLGYSRFEHRSRNLHQEMLVYMPSADSVKIVKFKIKNTSKVVKKLSLTGFFEMAFGGANREDTKDYLKTVRDGETGALIIRNTFHESFKKALAFVDLNGAESLITNDRDEFLGKNGEVINPSAMHRDKLSNVIHDDVDHCVALQSFFDLAPNEEKEIVALLGGGQSIEEVQYLIKKYRHLANCETALHTVKSNWHDKLNRIQIETPDESLNTLFNSRLLYQLISSRLLGRTGYFQPSGAYGFRDQLQDSMALVWSQPAMTKEIILKASHHQFLEGDAQNWWHEHNSFGVRTAFSDHQLWLAYVTSFYVEATGDHKILEETESYMMGPILDFINNSNWAGVPEVTVEKYDLYDHCLRAIEKTFVFGENGLPLIGKGDWNDGLNKVGEKGEGESVWLGWFLHFTIRKFIPYIRQRGDFERVKRYETTADNLKNALERKAWDGKWYKRAFFDNGTPLGSRTNREFKIDSISQSWSVLSGAGREDRQKTAMHSVAKYLFQDDNLLTLISPPVKDSPMDPGYIKDYPPGVRENGAQYNHAALWAAQAYAELKDPVTMMKIIDSVNPIKRSLDKEKVDLYRVEPYAVASDIYAKPVEAGRGGWTWYTGSAGVMYRAIFENILGIKIKADKMEIDPCIPKEWPEFSLKYTYKNTKYNIRVINNSSAFEDFPSSRLNMKFSAKGDGIKTIKVDNTILSGHTINLIDDDKDHEVEVKL